METPHRCTEMDSARRVITVKYPEVLPNEPYYMTYNHCECGRLVTVEAVTIESHLERSRHVLHQLQQVNHHANQALANYLGQNYEYPPARDPTWEDARTEDEEVVVDDDSDEMDDDDRDRAWLSRNDPPRRANLLGPVLDNLLTDRDYDSEDDDDENEDDQRDYYGDRRLGYRSPYDDQPRRPNLLGPVLQNWHPEYDFEDEPIAHDRPAMPREYYANDCSDADDEDDEPER